ncbi:MULTISPECIES: hypothetical protein [Vibrio]|uniref:hypothetical protein n=1 Tax=Vibrio TaxID=662 RepID=UPI0004E62C3C|nr:MULTISPECIES: hypothetical protein [Vibrio]KFE92843.1 hypothetical protein HB39_26050 [Vibrio parahaemolyticus]MBE4098978.1 hypothetical protein [Vibrio parahaemolyticus]MBE4134204.1 hypothetical protein [Vibrio parahaemolyticus]MBX5335227.1 hypothetical protein [Vibrio parahaemolyticus]MCG9679135.1 hypothetical protein [Vibrio sp. Isolate24]
MEYSIDEASKEIGKRVLVSIRIVYPNRDDEYDGFWGIIVSAHENGLLVKVEGGSEDEFEMIPPDLEFLQPAKYDFYQFKDNQIIENVDYEVYWSAADDPEYL